MNDILKALQAINAVESKKSLNESTVTECPPDMGSMSAPINQGNPVTASITLNASGMEHVADLMRLMQQAGLEKAGPPAPATLPMRTDMERLRDKMNGLEAPVSAPKEQYFDVDDVTGGGDDVHSKKAPEDIRVKDSSLSDTIRDSEIEEWDNEPEEEYGDHLDMIKRLAGGLNKEKRMYKAAQPGDNAMAVESEDDEDDNKVKESIKSRLLKALSEKKAKPDFLDMDKDGDKKEPMKKAAKDAGKGKGSKPKKGQVPPQFKKKTNEAEVQSPSHELSDVSRKASAMAQKIKRKINSGEQMDDRDYNQLAELGSVLSRLGASFGPKSMKDVFVHMKQYTDDRNEEGHNYPEFSVDRFKELIAMASSTGESAVSEISSDLAKRYTKNAKVDRDNTDYILKRDGSTNDWKANQQLHRRNAKRTKGINRAAKRIDK